MPDPIDDRYAENTPLPQEDFDRLEAEMGEDYDEDEDLELDADDDGSDI